MNTQTAVSLDVLNVWNRTNNDVQYAYSSQLVGETLRWLARHIHYAKEGAYMGPTEINRTKRMLETLRTQVLARIAEQRGGVHSRAEVAAEQFAPTQDSHAQTMTEHDIALALSEHETLELTHIDDALQRLAAGTYGLCTACGQAIATPRLKAWPDVARCIGCQEKAETANP